MIDSLIDHPRFRRLFPPVGGGFLIVLFASLGTWQLDRAAEKNALRAMFDEDVPRITLSGDDVPPIYQPVEVRGRYDSEQQVILERQVLNGQVGYFVLAPLETAGGDAVMVNRGWIPGQPGRDQPDLDIGDGERQVRGRVGRLPPTGVRRDTTLAEIEGWPRIARSTTIGEIAEATGRNLRPFVLLLDSTEDGGFRRAWLPEDSNPMTHYNYALQWFAMATAVLAGLIWWWRRAKAR